MHVSISISYENKIEDIMEIYLYTSMHESVNDIRVDMNISNNPLA